MAPYSIKERIKEKKAVCLSFSGQPFRLRRKNESLELALFFMVAMCFDHSKSLTYGEVGRSIGNYAAPVWTTNCSDTSLEKIQRTQNEALRIITSSHMMSSIHHLHSETKMLLVKDHLNLLSAKYLVHCLDTENACYYITKMDHPPRTPI